MDNFTLDQAHRMRCTLENWRVDLTTWEGNGGGGTAPDLTTGPSPTDGTVDASLATSLGWSAAGGATQYDVYFGTSATPPLASSNQSSTSFSPGTLSYSTTYFWRVDSENSVGVTQGDLWSFTTEADPGPGGGPIFFDGFESGTLGGWARSSNEVRVGTVAETGAFAAELRRAGSMSQTIDTGAASSVSVSWDWRTSGYDNGESVTCTITGGSGGTLTLNSANSYQGASVVVTGVSGSVTVEFRGGANRNNEQAYIDNVDVR